MGRNLKSLRNTKFNDYFLVLLLFCFFLQVLPVWAQKPAIDIIIVTDQNCSFCSVELPKKILKETFSDLNFKTYDYNDEQVQTIIEEYDFSTLPQFIIERAIKKAEQYQKFSSFFEERKDKILLKKDLTGIFLFLNRKKVPDRLDFFLDFYEQNASNVFNNLLDFCQDNKINLFTHFIISKEKEKNYYEEEIKVALAVAELYPQKLINYLKHRIKNIRSMTWLSTLDASGITYKPIRKLIHSQQINKLIARNYKLTDELDINKGNVILVNNQRIFRVFNAESKELKTLFNKK